MGYTTDFIGFVSVEPPLDAEEIAFLKKFNETRRMKRTKGPYFVDGTGYYGQGHDADVLEYNEPPDTQPGLWCHWVPSYDGMKIVWDGGEKFYNSVEWMQYLIDHFIGAAPKAKNDLPFLRSHVLNGTIDAQGEESEDRWTLVVTDNVVTQCDFVEGSWSMIGPYDEE